MLKGIKKYLTVALLCLNTISQTTTYWNWNIIDTNSIQFPQGFLWGTTNLAYEIEGNATSNNTWYLHESYIKTDGKPFAHERSGIACDHWDRYTEDIQLMHQSGLN